jgi:hypothetical protein
MVKIFYFYNKTQNIENIHNIKQYSRNFYMYPKDEMIRIFQLLIDMNNWNNDDMIVAEDETDEIIYMKNKILFNSDYENKYKGYQNLY